MTSSDFSLSTLHADHSKVSGYCLKNTQIHARVFLPIFGENDKTFTWEELCELAHVPLVSALKWPVLKMQLPERFAHTLRTSEGKMDFELITALVKVLQRHTSTPESLNYAMWIGEVEEQLGELCDPYPPELEHLRDLFGGLNLYKRTSAWALRRAGNVNSHYPVYWWPADESFLIAHPIYHDSLYLSGTESLLADIRDAGFTALQIDPLSPLPSERD